MAAKKNSTFEDVLNLTPLEKEIITLKATLDMINDMVNHENMLFTFGDPDTWIALKTMTHKAFFNILLVDLLSTPGEFFNGNQNYLERLKAICENPLLEKENVGSLERAVNDFATWLAETVIVEKRWFPSIGLEIDLRIRRQAFVTMCGNINKHNFTQQTRQAKKLQTIFRENDQSVPLDKCLITLEEFQAQFYEDVFSYHAATIAEFLNNIRWGIFRYASPERQRCVTYWRDEKLDWNHYAYEYPSEIVSDLGKTYYWNLMNDMMSPPYLQRFEVTNSLKSRY